jgi:two-component system chemotaxis response regulator CheB
MARRDRAGRGNAKDGRDHLSQENHERSSLTQKGAETSLQALSAGAVEIITKPTTGLKNFLIESAAELVAAIRAAAHSNVRNLGKRSASPAPLAAPAGKLTADAILPAASGHAMAQTTERIVAIGTSTGGTQALEAVLKALPRVCPGIVIVQHMPEKFTASFAERLNSICAIEVREARNNDRILPGLALIAPGGKHLMVTRSGAYYHAQVIDGPQVNRHRPSVDVLFRSVAKFAGKNATGIIMTGMGDDGARGLKEMLDAGAATVAQDEASCVVFGMPKEAIKLNAAQRIMPLEHIHQAILNG